MQIFVSTDPPLGGVDGFGDDALGCVIRAWLSAGVRKVVWERSH